MGNDLSEFPDSFGSFLRMTGQTHASGRVKCHLLLLCCKTKCLEKQVKQIMTKSATLAEVLVATHLPIRTEIQNLAMLPNNPRAAHISQLWADLDHWVVRLTPGSYGNEVLPFSFVAKIPREVWEECQATGDGKTRTPFFCNQCSL